MSAFRQAYTAMVRDELRCKGCTAMNRPGATYIVISEDGERAECTVCNRYGPIAAFQQPPKEK